MYSYKRTAAASPTSLLANMVGWAKVLSHTLADHINNEWNVLNSAFNLAGEEVALNIWGSEQVRGIPQAWAASFYIKPSDQTIECLFRWEATPFKKEQDRLRFNLDDSGDKICASVIQWLDKSWAKPPME